MATKITTDMIKQINELYQQFGTYAAVAREIGISPSTVKKYVDKFYIPESKRTIKRFDIHYDLPDMDLSAFVGVENYGDLCVLSPEEAVGIQQLWEELGV